MSCAFVSINYVVIYIVRPGCNASEGLVNYTVGNFESLNITAVINFLLNLLQDLFVPCICSQSPVEVSLYSCVGKRSFHCLICSYFLA